MRVELRERMTIDSRSKFPLGKCKGTGEAKRDSLEGEAGLNLDFELVFGNCIKIECYRFMD